MNITKDLIDVRTAYLQFIVDMWEKELEIHQNIREAYFKTDHFDEIITSIREVFDALWIKDKDKISKKEIKEAFAKKDIPFKEEVMDWFKFIETYFGVDVFTVEEFTQYLPEGNTAHAYQMFFNPYQRHRPRYNHETPMDAYKGFSNAFIWSAPEDNLVLMVPKRPKNDRDYTRALAEYYEMYPSFFGHGPVTNGPVDTKLVEANRNLSPELIYTVNYDTKHDKLILPADDSSSGDTPEAFLALGLAFQSIMTNHWQYGKGEDLSGDYLKYLVEISRFKNPWGFRMWFEEDENFVWDGKKQRWENDKGTRYVQAKVVLNMPLPPSLHEQAVALASYNNSGEAYPFTCF